MTYSLNLHDISGNKANMPFISTGTLRVTNASHRRKFRLWKPGGLPFPCPEILRLRL